MAQDHSQNGASADVLHLPLAETVPDTGSLAPIPDGAGLEQVAGPDERLVLSLEMLLPDADGAVVLDDMLSAQIDLEDGVGVAGQGIVEAAIEAGGRDVIGLAFVALENGVTLYYPPDADITFG